MNQTDPTADFDGCRRACRLAGAHTLVSGECEHAPEPEPTVSLSKRVPGSDGYPTLCFDSYTVPQLAELITTGLRASGLPVDADAFVDIASVAAYAIVHRNDEQTAAAASAVFREPPSRAAVLLEAAEQLRAQGQHLTGEFNDSDILHEDGPAATVATWKRAADLLRRLAVEADGSRVSEAWLDVCVAAGVLQRRAAEAQQQQSECTCGGPATLTTLASGITYEEHKRTCAVMADDAGARQQPETEAPGLDDSARIGKTLIWSCADVGRGEFGRGYRAAQEEARALLTGQRGPAAADSEETRRG